MIRKDLSETPTLFWQYIKSLRKDTGIPTLNTPSEIPAASDESKANALVNQFSSVFTKLNEDLDNIPDMPHKIPSYA